MFIQTEQTPNPATLKFLPGRDVVTKGVVDFTDPWIAGVDEIIVTSPQTAPIATADDLSGKEVFVRESSSYYQSLLKLNARLSSEGKPPAKLTPAPEDLEDEDVETGSENGGEEDEDDEDVSGTSGM